MFHFFVFGVLIDFLDDTFYLLQFQIDDIIHDALSQCYMFMEEIEVEVGIFGERIDYV